jgi:hypothetical protein
MTGRYRRPRPLRELWKSTKLTRFERIMAWLGWTRVDIVRIIPCAWCGEDFQFEGDTAGDPPRFCSTAHKTSANKARARRAEDAANAEAKRAARAAVTSAVIKEVPQKPTEAAVVPKAQIGVCRCRNHMGTSKVRYPTNEDAAVGLMRRHVSHGRHWIYRCPDSECWHITSQDQERRMAS